MSEKLILLVTQLLLIFFYSPPKKYEAMDINTSLHYSMRESKDKNVHSPLLILLHGHGSNEKDLFTLSEKIPDNWIVVSVRAPYKIAENSYRWYEVKMVNNKIQINIEEEENSRKQIRELILEITKRYQVDGQRIIVAGFSQGANMSEFLGLSEPNLIAGFGVFSGRFVEEFLPYISKSPILKSRMGFISHGSEDNMLLQTYADENITQLKNLGIQITYCLDNSGHTISEKQWNEFSKWLLNFN